jgi:aspartate/methionine/tyrosine aminotransferase
MDSPDMQLVARETPPGWINLAIGEPEFLQEAMAPLYPKNAPVAEGDLTYPPCDGYGEIRQTLVDQFGRHIVLTNGGKQALAAGMFALRRRFPLEYATAKTPFWPCFPSLAAQGGLRWMSDTNVLSRCKDVLRIWTWPNNPDGTYGSLIDTNQVTLWDAVYASPVYGCKDPWWCPSLTMAKVGSASKLYGLSGLRLGWLQTDDPDVARYAAEYVEITTSGVSVAAQNYFETQGTEPLHCRFSWRARGPWRHVCMVQALASCRF